MMKVANGAVDPVAGLGSCQSIKNSSEDLEMYYMTVRSHWNLSITPRSN